MKTDPKILSTFLAAAIWAVGGDDELRRGIEEIGGHICLFVSVNLFFVVSCSASLREIL